MVFLIIALLSSPLFVQAYEIVWRTSFENEEGYGYNGDNLYLPTNEWSIDLRGTSLSDRYYKVENGILEGERFFCSYQLNDNLEGVIWQSREILLNANQDYYCLFSLGTSSNWDQGYTDLLCDFIKLGYYDDNQNYHQVYLKDGVTNRGRITGMIRNTSSCKLVVEVDMNAYDEFFHLISAGIYKATSLGNSSDLIISKLCSPSYFEKNERYIQITNIGSQLIDLSHYSLEAVHNNNVLKTWDLQGLIIPKESLVIGDTDADDLFCDIGDNTWSRKNLSWQGIATDNDGAQLVRANSKEITDKVIGVNFNNGYAVRDYSALLATNETDPSSWNYYEIDSASQSYPGVFDFDQSLPVELLSTNFLFTDAGFSFTWTSQQETNLLGYNLYYWSREDLAMAIKVNSHMIFANNSVQFNSYSYPLTELASSGYLWLEIVSSNQASIFTKATYYNKDNLADNQDALEIIDSEIIAVYPNPFGLGALLEIKQKQEEIEQICLYNIKGQLVGEITVQKTVGKYKLDKVTANLASGIYFLQVKFKNSVINKKLILTK